jgi:hypothetical protein
MKKLLISLIALIALLAGCNQNTSPEEIAKIVYEWEKATLTANYEREQELLYETGTYEIHKDTPARKNGLKYEDMQVEVYHDKEKGWYYSIVSYTNPEEGNKVEDVYVVRKKDEGLKIDIEKSEGVDESKIKESFKREDCIHCE